MSSKAFFLCAVLVLGVVLTQVSARVVFPPATYQAPLSVYDPLEAHLCVCDGSSASTYLGCTMWQSCQSCQTGQIAHTVYNNKEYVEFGLIGNVASSFIDLGAALPQETWTYSLGSLHYVPENASFVYFAGQNWTSIPKDIVGQLNTTFPGYRSNSTWTAGKYYLVRLSNGPQSDMSATELFMSVAILSDQSARWTIFWVDDVQAPYCLKDILQVEKNQTPAVMTSKDLVIYISVAVGVTLIAIVITGILLNRKINNIRQVDYKPL